MCITCSGNLYFQLPIQDPTRAFDALMWSSSSVQRPFCNRCISIKQLNNGLLRFTTLTVAAIRPEGADRYRDTVYGHTVAVSQTANSLHQARFRLLFPQR